MRDKKFEYVIIPLEKGTWTGLRHARLEYPALIEEMSQQGWRFVQMATIVDNGNTLSAELIFERPFANN